MYEEAFKSRWLTESPIQTRDRGTHNWSLAWNSVGAPSEAKPKDRSKQKKKKRRCGRTADAENRAKKRSPEEILRGRKTKPALEEKAIGAVRSEQPFSAEWSVDRPGFRELVSGERTRHYAVCNWDSLEALSL